MIRVIKIGFWTMLGGILGIIMVVTQGVGPCGPSSAVGALLLLGGIVTAVFGFLLVVSAFAWNAVRQPRTKV